MGVVGIVTVEVDPVVPVDVLVDPLEVDVPVESVVLLVDPVDELEEPVDELVDPVEVVGVVVIGVVGDVVTSVVEPVELVELTGDAEGSKTLDIILELSVSQLLSHIINPASP